MEINGKITDELIAKYISGNTTEEEDNFIHDYLAQNPDFANDLLDMATALRHQHKHDEEIRNGLEEQPKEAKHIFLSRRFLYSAAASIVLLIGVGFYLKMSTKNEFIQEQPSIAEVNTGISNTPTDPNGNIEETVLETPAIIDFGSEEVLIANNHEPDVQPVVNISESQVDQSLFADNSTPQQQQETNVPSANPDMPLMAAQTVYQDNSGEPCKEEAVFDVSNIPTTWNPNKVLVLKWECNATIVTIEFSSDGGKTWESRYTNPHFNQLSIPTTKLDIFKLDNPEGFNWRITAQYRDGNLVRQGTIRFTDGNK